MAAGEVMQVIGPVVDVRFKPEELPEILNALVIEDKEHSRTLTVEVAQHLGDDVVRCVAMASTDGLSRGLEAIDTGAPISVPVGAQTLGRMFDLLGAPIDNKPAPEAAKRMPIHREPPSFEEFKSTWHTGPWMPVDGITIALLNPKAQESCGLEMLD